MPWGVVRMGSRWVGGERDDTLGVLFFRARRDKKYTAARLGPRRVPFFYR